MKMSALSSIPVTRGPPRGTELGLGVHDDGRVAEPRVPVLDSSRSPSRQLRPAP